MSELLTMSTRELTRLEIMQRLRDKRLTQVEAATALGLSTRQIKRLWKAYRREGERALISRRRSRPSNHRLNVALVARAEEFIRALYHDFGPTLAHERVDRTARAAAFGRERPPVDDLIGAVAGAPSTPPDPASDEGASPLPRRTHPDRRLAPRLVRGAREALRPARLHR